MTVEPLMKDAEPDEPIIVSPSLHLTKPIVLVGIMGSGKSSIGKRLAKALKVPFVDSDNEIEKAAQCSVSDIFAFYGEQKFRDLELRVLQRLLQEDAPAVIATGGGAFAQDTVREMANTHGITIWLDADLDVLVERVSRKNTRPLLESGDKREILSNLLERRRPFYEQAHLHVQSDTGAHENVVRRIIETIRPLCEQ